MLLFLVSVRTLNKAKISITDYCKNMMPEKAYSLYKKKTKLYDTRNFCSKYFKHQPMSMRSQKNSRGNQCIDNSAGSLKDHQ
jgi:hypothetical protein